MGWSKYFRNCADLHTGRWVDENHSSMCEVRGSPVTQIMNYNQGMQSTICERNTSILEEDGIQQQKTTLSITPVSQEHGNEATI